MNIQNALASLAVKDLQLSHKWYEKLFDRPADSIPMSEVAEWHFEGGGWLQVYQTKDHIGVGSVTLSVKDIAAQIASLKKLGIDPGKEVDTEKVKLVMIKDLDGNSIAFAQAKDASIAQ